MKVIRDINQIRRKFKKPVITIGIFDGVHLAHQRIIREVVRRAKLIGGSSIVVTFNPHPLKTVTGYQAVSLITTVEHRLDLIRRLGVDVCLLLEFDQRFARIPAQVFIKRKLLDKVGINYLMIGKRFCFGKDRGGNFQLLQKLAREYHFQVREINPIKLEGKIVSSSRIRSLIRQGKICQANKFLGRRFSISGKVKSGRSHGRSLGYPTANIDPVQEIVPAIGVYAVFIKVDKGIFPGILNIGIRPTFGLDRQDAVVIEAHIFDFSRDIYGQVLEVYFVQRLRPEKKFTQPAALLNQIKIDEQQARKILRPANKPTP